VCVCVLLTVKRKSKQTDDEDEILLSSMSVNIKKIRIALCVNDKLIISATFSGTCTFSHLFIEFVL